MVIRLSVGDFTVCGRGAPPRRGAKRIDNLRFSILLGLQLSLIGQSGADHRPATASKSGNGSRVTLAFVSQNVRSSQIAYCCTYGLPWCRPLSPDSRFVRHCYPPGDLLLPFGQFTLCRTQRRAADLCSRNVYPLVPLPGRQIPAEVQRKNTPPVRGEHAYAVRTPRWIGADKTKNRRAAAIFGKSQRLTAPALHSS